MISNRQLFLSHVAQTISTPLALEIDRAEGIYLYSPSGKKYMDAIAGISVSNVGHCHPMVVKAIQEQATKYMHLMVYGEYIYTPQVKLCEKLASLLPDNLDNIYLVNSGTEATEGAIKLVRKYTGRSRLVSFHKSYHGSSTGALSLMGDEYFKEMYRPLLPDTLQITYGKLEDLVKIDHRTAAVFFEPVQAESGVHVPSTEYVQALRNRCTEVGALLVFDEIQTGFGRTGTMFAFEHYHVVPDVLLLAKGMGGGLPIGAFISSKSIMSVLMDHPILGHITTFGGNAVTASASLACIAILQQDNLIASIESKGLLFDTLLHHHRAVAYRRKGLMLALEFESFELNKKIIDSCIDNGLITDWFLFAPHCLRIGPPLIITEEEIQLICDIINTQMHLHL